MIADEDLEKLANRMGAEALRARLEMESRLRECQGEGQGKGLFHLENKFDLYAFIRFCLKVSGFWNRCYRNYLDIQVERNEVFLPKLPKAFDGYTILQLTDLHADLDPKFPDVVKSTIAPLEYDCLVLTGDFRTCTYGDHSGATHATVDILSQVTAPMYGILGNHDFLAKVPTLEKAGVRFLLNEHVVLRRGDAELSLIGIDDPNFYRTHCLETAMDGIPKEGAKVLLSHSPQTHCAANEVGIDLLLAGHTHGGQICLPGRIVVMHDGSAPRRVLSGRWKEGTLQGYTSRGTGASGLPARLNCMPEVTLHTLRSQH